MTKVFLSHSGCDKPFVRELADYLRRHGDPIQIWLDEAAIQPGDNIVAKIEQGLDADIVLLILSPDSVASDWVAQEWTDAFWEQTNAGRTKLVGVLYKECNIPRLIRNKKYFDLRTNHLTGFEQIRTWLLNQTPVPPRLNHLPQRRPLFIGREPELTRLRARLREPGALVPIEGIPGGGKTTLALEFAHRHQADFEAVWWLPCQQTTRPALAGELARQLGLKLDGDLDSMERSLRDYCALKRALLILDNVENEDPAWLIPGGAVSVLLTTRVHDLRFLRGHKSLTLPVFTEEQCFELFRDVVGEAEVARHETECRALFTRLGHLPAGISIASASIREDIRCTIAGLAARLPADVTELIRDSIAARSPAAQDLLAAMAACAPGGFRLGLPAAMLQLGEDTSLDLLHELRSHSLAEELDRDTRRYRLHALIREAAAGWDYGQAHAEAVRDAFEDWESNWKQCEGDLPDFEVAFSWALNHTADGPALNLIYRLAYLGLRLTERVGRPAESFAICDRTRSLAERYNDRPRLHAWLGNQAVILKTWSRLEEAMALHKKEEAICLDLADHAGLQRSYCNQALILRAWGRLEESMAVLKRQEATCVDLGDRAGLEVGYGNQATIMQEWGRLEEAMTLLKRQETICLEIGDQSGLMRSYGNQAIILQDWERPEDALALLRKVEAICLELGNRAGLQLTYGNQATTLQALGLLDDALALVRRQEAICLDLGDRASLQLSYGNQASMLHAKGRFEDAMVLLRRQEAICRELNLPGSLWRSLVNQAIVLDQTGHPDEAARLRAESQSIQAQLMRGRETFS